MKSLLLIMFVIIVLITGGCSSDNRNIILPEATNDKTISSVGIEEKAYEGNGYTITIPQKNYRFEKDYDDGTLEEKWEYTKLDDTAIKVTTYKNTDAGTARSRFLMENDDYIFEDFMGYPVCGTEPDGDTLWFSLYESDGDIYIVSQEYPKYADESIITELADIAKTFKVAK